MKVVIDANVIIDVLEKRKGFFEDSYAVCRLAAEGKINAITPAGSIADVYYIIKKSGKSAQIARESIAVMLQLVHPSDTMAVDITQALISGIADFEDAIIAMGAKREKADYIITRNEKDFSGSPVKALSPSLFLESLK